MTIGEKIKYFRCQKGMTQEKLASELYLSYQAVSKWERNETLPDITIISKLAKVLEVSCDAILTEDSALIEIEIDKIISEATSKELKLKIEILENANRKFPNNEKIIMELIQAYSMASSCEKWNDYRQKLIYYAEYIAQNSKSTKNKYSAIQILCYIYRDIKNYDRIKAIAEQLPTLEQCREALIYHSMQGEKYKNGIYDYVIKLIDTLGTMLSVLLYPNNTQKIGSQISELKLLAESYKL